MKRLILLLILGVIFFSGCKKSTTDRITTQDQLLGKWKVATITEEDIVSGLPQTNTYTGQTADYIDFRDDGKVYYNVDANLDTFTYHILNDQLLVQDISDSFSIITLTSTNFTERHTSGSYKYTEYLYK